MDSSGQLAEALTRLVRQIRADVYHNTQIGPEWLASEGERVFELAAALPVSLQELSSSLGATRLTDFLGEGWLGCHGESRALVKQLERLLSRHNAA